MSDLSVIELSGKYKYIRDDRGQRVLRYNEPWRDLTGDNFVLAMAHEIEELRERLKKLEALEAGGVDDWEWYDACMEGLDV